MDFLLNFLGSYWWFCKEGRTKAYKAADATQVMLMLGVTVCLVAFGIYCLTR
jgi:hypothetical protein